MMIAEDPPIRRVGPGSRLAYIGIRIKRKSNIVFYYFYLTFHNYTVYNYITGSGCWQIRNRYKRWCISRTDQNTTRDLQNVSVEYKHLKNTSNKYRIPPHSMKYVSYSTWNQQTCHTDPNLEISLVSSSENVVFVTCHMSLVFSWFLEKWIFQILLVSFSVTFDTMRGNMVLLQGVPKDLYTYAASRVIVDVFQSHIESLQLLLKSLSATLVPGTSDMYHTRRQTKASGTSTCFLAEIFGRNGPSKLGAVIRRLHRHVYYLPSRFVLSLSI